MSVPPLKIPTMGVPPRTIPTMQKLLSQRQNRKIHLHQRSLPGLRTPSQLGASWIKGLVLGLARTLSATLFAIAGRNKFSSAEYHNSKLVNALVLAAPVHSLGTSASVSGFRGPPFAGFDLAQKRGFLGYPGSLKSFLPPRACPLLALSGHGLVHRTCPLLGAKRTSSLVVQDV